MSYQQHLSMLPAARHHLPGAPYNVLPGALYRVLNEHRVMS